MDNNKVKTYTLENLSCANCAAKIERGVSNISGVENASVSFASKKLRFEVSEVASLDKVIQQTKKIIKKLEPDTIMIDESEGNYQQSTSTFKYRIIRLVVGVIFFTLGLVLKVSEWQEFTLFFMSYLIFGGDVILKAVKNIFKGQVFDENLLMTIATIGAFIIGEFAEGVAVMLFFQVGELFQSIAVDRSRKSITDLMDIKPEYANLKIGDNIEVVNPSKITVGSYIVVKPGEKIPLDGRVIEGRSFVDTTALTGESVLREVETGSNVLSGFINTNGLLTIEVTKIFSESAVSVILELVENASSKKAPTENFITKFARYYTPFVVFSAALIAFLPLFFIPGATLSEWGYRALVFLVISCPCALVISIPLGFFGGIGGASRRGILVKGSNYLEALNNIDTIVFDKTGTLTKGVFNVTEIHAVDGYTKNEVLEYAAYAEVYSNHPIALSIVKSYNKEIDKKKITAYEEISGNGVKVNRGHKVILAGNAKMMLNNNIEFEKADTFGTVIYLAIDNEYIGNLIISDEIKEDSIHAINELKSLGIRKTVMLTGDLKHVGESIGRTLDLDEVYTELLPQEKVSIFESLKNDKSHKGNIIYVGDGINDAPVLAIADVGIAMGGLGSDAAIEAADIVIMTDEPSKIATSIRIAKRTRRIVWQNIIFAMSVKGVFLVLGALGVASMWEAVFADVGVSVLAILNAMRVIKTKSIL